MTTQNFIRSISQGRREIFMIPHTQIIPKDSFNKRKDFGNIEALAMSILNDPEGIKETVRVKLNKETGEVELINGERRYRACQWLVENGHEAPLMPCRFEASNTSDKELLIGQATMNSGKSMTMLEKAAIYLDLKELHGMNGQEIADRLETTKAAVSNGIILLKYGSPKVISMIEKGQISASAANEVIKKYKTNHAAQESHILDLLSSTNNPPSKAATKESLGKGKGDGKGTGENSEADKNSDNNSEESGKTDTTKPPNWKAESQQAASTGSGGGGGGLGSKNVSVEARYKKVDKMMEEINPDKCNTDRFNSLELLMTYLDGKSDIRSLKNHLLGKG